MKDMRTVFLRTAVICIMLGIALTIVDSFKFGALPIFLGAGSLLFSILLKYYKK